MSGVICGVSLQLTAGPEMTEQPTVLKYQQVKDQIWVFFSLILCHTSVFFPPPSVFQAHALIIEFRNGACEAVQGQSEHYQGEIQKSGSSRVESTMSCCTHTAHRAKGCQGQQQLVFIRYLFIHSFLYLFIFRLSKLGIVVTVWAKRLCKKQEELGGL